MALRPVKKYITIGENTGEGSTMEHWDRLWPGGYTFAYADGLFRPSTDTFLLGAFPRLRRGLESSHPPQVLSVKNCFW